LILDRRVRGLARVCSGAAVVRIGSDLDAARRAERPEAEAERHHEPRPAQRRYQTASHVASIPPLSGMATSVPCSRPERGASPLRAKLCPTLEPIASPRSAPDKIYAAPH